MGKPRSRSTETNPTFPNAVRWSDIAAHVVAPFARILAVPDRKVESTLADPKRTSEILGKLPGAELALLELLVETRGSLALDVLVRVGKQRHGWDPPKTDAIVEGLERALLAFRVHQTEHWRETRTYVGILDLAAEAIAGRVLGVSLPTSVPSPEQPGEVGRSRVRETVAILAAAAHAIIKTTQRFDTNRSSAKKLAAMLGMDEERVLHVLDTGLGCGILDVTDGLALPNPSALRALARGERSLLRQPEDHLAMAWTPADRWISRDALARAIATERVDTVGNSAFALAESAVARAPFATTTHEGHVFVRRSAPDIALGSGDGHVTPSFEIMLGPRADLEIVALLGLAAAPVRMDRVITLKLTPASVTAAVTCGLGWTDIARALDAVAPHPVPENVAVMVREWAEGARIVRLRDVVAAECSTKEAADAAAKALGDRVVARPTPTLLLLDVDDRWDPTRILAKAGVRALPHGAVPRMLSPTTNEDEGEDDVPAVPTAPAVLVARADPALAKRFVEARAGGFPVVVQTSPSLVAAISAMRDLPAARAPDVRAFLDLLVGCATAAEPELGRWTATLSLVERRRVAEMIAMDPLEFMVWLVVPPSARRTLCDTSTSLQALLETAELMPPTSHVANQVNALIVKSVAVRQLFGYDEPAPSKGKPDERLAPQPAGEVQRRFTEAVGQNQVLWLRVSSKTNGDRVVSVSPERVITRGAEVMLLGIDADTLENRSYPLRTVVAACLRPLG